MTDNLAQENVDLRARLIAALQSCNCPHRSGQGEGWITIVTIGECTRRGECGCDAGDLIKISQRMTS